MQPTAARSHLVLLPGMDGTGRLFLWLQRALPSDVGVTVVGYPADRATSSCELAEIVLAGAPSAPYVIVAESYSGAIALQVAARRPPGLCGVILSAGFVQPPVPAWLGLLPLERLFRLPPSARLLRLALLERTCEPDVLAEVGLAIRAVEPAVLAARAREILRLDARAALQACEVPLAYLAATRDRLIGLRGLRDVRRVAPSCEVEMLDGPHLLLQARPREAARVISGYAARWCAA